MTREDAIKILKECRERKLKYTFYTIDEYQTATDMAIQALEQEPDAIHNEREQAYMKGYEDASKRYRTELCEKCEVGNPCLYCDHDFSEKEMKELCADIKKFDFILQAREEMKLPSVSTENPNRCGDVISRQAAIDIVQNWLDHCTTPPQALEQPRWIPVSERLPETDNKNSINNYNVLLWVKNKTHPEYEPQIYLGKLRHVDGDDGSGNFWGLETKPCDWTIWGWHYFNEPEVIAWMPLPQPYKAEREE